MPLPRKVPWRSLDEFAQVQRWIFNDEDDLAARHQGLKRLKTWVHLHPSTHPIAISSALSLLSSLSLLQATPRPDSHTIRLALAASLVRFINTLVDPYQTGQFARPIAMISAELGIPGWLVELRHAGTHENLPSLEVLTEGSQEALSYLNVSFFLPTLNASSTQAYDHPLPVSPLFLSHKAVLPPLLKQYKVLAKAIAKDHSTSPLPFRQIQKDVLRWLDAAEMRGGVGRGVKVLAEALVGVDGEAESPFEEIELGGLVPVSKKKRSLFTEEAPYPPRSLLDIYTPLISVVADKHVSFPSALVGCVLSVLEPSRLAKGKGKEFDRGEDTLASWLVWLFDQALEDEERNGVVRELVRVAWESDRSRRILRIIAKNHQGFESELNGLLGMLESETTPVQMAPLQESTALLDSVLSEMESRLEQVRNLTRLASAPSAEARVGNRLMEDVVELGPGRESGWSLMSEEEWGEGLPMGAWIEV